MRLVPAIIIAVAIILAPVTWLVTSYFLRGGGTSDGFLSQSGPSVDSEARIEIARLQTMIDALQAQIEELQRRIDALPHQRGAVQPAPQQEPFAGGGVDYAQVVLIADRTNANSGLTVAGSRFLESFLGRPRQSMNDQSCQPMDNPGLKGMLVDADVGPIRVRMLQPAVESLQTVFERVRNTDLALYERIRSSGSLCVRLVRGSASSISNHAFGLALDINIDGVLDRFADGRTQVGLTIMKDFFKAEGWIWGAGFRREDSMHFEVSREKLEEWRAAGKI